MQDRQPRSRKRFEAAVHAGPASRPRTVRRASRPTPRAGDVGLTGTAADVLGAAVAQAREPGHH